MLFKTYIATGLLALALFAWAQYHGWSVWSVNEAKPQQGHSGSSGTARSATHK